MTIDDTLLYVAASPLDSELLVLIPIAIIGLFLLVLAALIYVREAGGNKNLHSSASSVSLPKLKVDQDLEQPIHERSTQESLAKSPSHAETKKLNVKSMNEFRDEITASPFEYLNVVQSQEENGELEEAGQGYKKLGLLKDEIRVLKKQDPTPRLASLLRAVGSSKEELQTLTELVLNEPKNWKHRASLIGAYLEANQKNKAVQLYETALEERVSLGLEYDFFVLVGLYFENASHFEIARECYKNAATAEETNTALQARMNYLKQLIRLKNMAEPVSAKLRTSDVYRIAKENLKNDSGVFDTDFDVNTDEVQVDAILSDESQHVAQQGWKILVGHPAYGKSINTNKVSALRIDNPVTRMAFESTLSEGESTVLFQTRDQLIDFPVTLRLHRVFLKDAEFMLLSARLQRLNKLFHPNITKLLYADSVHSVVRVVSEYHQGGSFYSMIKQLKQIGLTLGVRLLLQVASGLVYAHKFGVIHGDLRAENIMIGHDQLIKIVDFSLQPWPVRNLPSDNGIPREEVQVDLLQFADLIEFTISYCNVTSFDEDSSVDPKAKVNKIVDRIRENEFESMAAIHHELSKVLEDLIPRT